MDSRLLPVAGQDLPSRQVQVEGVEVPGAAVVDVPLFPGHVTPALPRVNVQPIRGHHAWLYSKSEVTMPALHNQSDVTMSD